MKTFQDLIKAGIAPSRYDTKLMGQTTDTDPLVRTYNNIWGIISDTHMSRLEDGRYVITGSMVSDQRKFSTFLYAERWGGYNFGNSSLKTLSDSYLSLCSLINRNNCVGSFEKINGDNVYVLTPLSDEQQSEKSKCSASIQCDGCCIGCSESVFPIKMSQITSNEKTLASILEANDSLLDKVNKLNESEDIDGKNWSVCYDMEGLRFINENKKYILKRNEN